jgi:predicted nucleotidyltransferase
MGVRVQTKEEVFSLLMRNRERLIEEFGVKRVGVFGSVVRGELKEDSDIDLVVEFKRGKARIRNIIELEGFLKALFGRNVDILTIHGVRTIRIPWIRDKIQRELEYVW